MLGCPVLRFVLNLRDNFLARRNILATNQIARKTIQPFENNNKRSQGRLGEGGPLIMFSRFSACRAYSFALLSNRIEIFISSLLLQE